jgi:hypothetical protein
MKEKRKRKKNIPSISTMFHISHDESRKMEETGGLCFFFFECETGFTKLSFQKTISLAVSCCITKRNPLSQRLFQKCGSRQSHIVTNAFVSCAARVFLFSKF